MGRHNRTDDYTANMRADHQAELRRTGWEHTADGMPTSGAEHQRMAAETRTPMDGSQWLPPGARPQRPEDMRHPSVLPNPLEAPRRSWVTTDPDVAEANLRAAAGSRRVKVAAVLLGVLLVAGCVGLTNSDSAAPVPPLVPMVPAAAPAPATVPVAAAPIVPDPNAPEHVQVTRVIDGDTFEVGDRTIRVLGIDSCEKNTPGGRDATRAAESFLDSSSGYWAITLTAEPGVDTDRYGRELRYVQQRHTRYGNVGDYGEHMVGAYHTGVYEGRNDASPAYLTQLRDADEYTGRDCSATPGPATTGDTDVDVDVDRDGNMPDGALTGGYCARKWWC